MKVLNLYAGIGGNRKLWEDVEVTAVEWDMKIANVYQELFPDDKVIVADAHQYLLDHFTEFDFIWSSPPCPTHSGANNFLFPQGVVRYPDMGLYQEIILLSKRFEGKYCVENVKSYYDPLIRPQQFGRHYFWCNFLVDAITLPPKISVTNAKNTHVRRSPQDHIKELEEYHKITLPPGLNQTFKAQILRNCVYPPLGQHILNCARGNTQITLAASINSKSLRIEE